MSEELKHACGLYAIWAPGTDVAWLTAQALDGQQTRGQEGAGIATTDGKEFYLKKGKGLVVQIFPSQKSVKTLLGHAAIGHNRYSTTGRDRYCNVQPIWVSGSGGEICFGHNGNLINSHELRDELEKKGEKFETTTDSEVVAKMLVNEKGRTWVESLRRVMKRLQGSYCLAILTKESVIVVRDPSGNRPLTIGKINGYWAVASESGVFNSQPLEFQREVQPGEIIVFDKKGMKSFPLVKKKELGLCAFEWIYFLRPDSVFGGVESAQARYRAGQLLAKNYPADADLVVPVPRSGFYAGDGFSHHSNTPIIHGIIANMHLRVFINNSPMKRQHQNERKYSTTSLLKGKRLVVIDDSIVRGNSNIRVLKMLKDAGAKEIHFRSTFPPIINPCYLGIDMATKEELIAARYNSKEEIEESLAKYWGIESIRYLSKEELVEAIGLPENELCLGCVGGKYAYKVDEQFKKEQFEKVKRAKLKKMEKQIDILEEILRLKIT